jgi:hypothetical protein
MSLKAYIPAGAVPIPGGTPVLAMSTVAPMKTQSGPKLGGHVMPGATGRVHRGAVWPRPGPGFLPAGHVVYDPYAAQQEYRSQWYAMLPLATGE